MDNKQVVYECLLMTLQVCVQAEKVPAARAALKDLMGMKPDDDLKKGAGTLEALQKDLQTVVVGGDKSKASKALTSIMSLLKEGKVTWDAVRTCKVGKDVGNAMKMGDPGLQTQGKEIVGAIQALAQKAGLGL